MTIHVNEIDTPFQKWLRRMGACINGRRWVGTQTFEEAYNAATCFTWMDWLMDQINVLQNPEGNWMDPNRPLLLVEKDWDVDESACVCVRAKYPAAHVLALMKMDEVNARPEPPMYEDDFDDEDEDEYSEDYDS